MRVRRPTGPAAVRAGKGSTAKTFAAIDMGSSSAKLVVLRQGDDGRWKVLEDVGETTFLGKDIGADKVLPKANQERTLEVLKKFVALAEKHGVEPRDVGMIATAVVRNTVNGGAFAREITTELGLEPKVLPGNVEAELGYLGAIQAFRQAGTAQRFASLDLGGGSFQLAIGDSERMQAGASTQVGANFVRETYFANEKISDADFAKADEGLKTKAPLPLPAKRLEGRQLVATGGISKFLRMHFGGDVIRRADIDALRREVGRLSYDDRVGLVQQSDDPKKLEVLGLDTVQGARDFGIRLPAAATLLLRILDGLGVDEVRVSTTDSRYAVIDRLKAGVEIDR